MFDVQGILESGKVALCNCINYKYSTVLMNFCLMLKNEVFKEFYFESGKILMQVARFISFATFIIHFWSKGNLYYESGGIY